MDFLQEINTWQVLGAGLVIIGLIGLLSPRSVWNVQHGWKFKKAEPSTLFLVTTRISSIALMLLGAAHWVLKEDSLGLVRRLQTWLHESGPLW